MLERRWTRWILILGVWTLLGALSAVRVALSFAYSGAAVSWRRALVIALADWYAWALLAPAIGWLARRLRSEQSGQGRISRQPDHSFSGGGER
jgi:hypothetical protein